MAKDKKDKKYPEKFTDTDSEPNCDGNCRHCVDEDICDKANEYDEPGVVEENFCDDDYDSYYDDMQGYV